jgi:hypothetical protein
MNPIASPQRSSGTGPTQTPSGKPDEVDLSDESVAGEEDPGAALDEPEPPPPPTGAPAKPAKRDPTPKR